MNLRRAGRVFWLVGLFVAVSYLRCFAEVKIIAVSPQGVTEGRDASSSIIVNFNQQMVPLERLPEGDGSGPLSVSPEVKGKFRWPGTSTLSFTPEKPLPLATEFTVTIPNGLKSEISGEILEQAYSWKFETLRPQLLCSYPYQDRDWVEPDKDIFLLFNQPVDPEQAKQYIKITETNGLNSEIDFAARYRVEKDSITLQEDHQWQNYQIIRATVSHVIVLTPGSGKKENGIVENTKKAVAPYLGKYFPAVFSPGNRLKKDCSYFVELKPGLPAKEGNLGLAAARSWRFKTYKTFKFIRPQSWPQNWDALEPTANLTVLFTNPVRYTDLLEVLTVEPKIEFPEYYYRSTHFSYPNYEHQCCPMGFNVELKPATVYKIKIKGKLTDKYGQTLGEDIETTFTTTDYAPRMTMPTGLGIVESYLKPPKHPLTLLNVDKVNWQLAKINPNYIVTLGTSNFDNYRQPITPPESWLIEKQLEPKITKNERRTIPLPLTADNSSYGIFFVQVDALRSLADGTRYRQAFLQVTDMGISGKFSPDNNLIYVSYLRNAKPVSDCRVELRDDRNEILWSGKTDKNGFAKTPGWEELKIIPQKKWDKPRIWVIAQKGRDTAFIHSGWGTGIYPYNFNIPYERNPEYPKYGGHLFSERGIYRPGETVYLKGVVRERKMGRWELPRINNYQLIIKDSRQAEVSKTTATLSAFGSFDYTCKLDQNSPTGYYNVYLWEKGVEEKQGEAYEYENDGDYRSGDRKIRLSASFRVEEYKPATFESTVRYDRDYYILGDTAAVKINGRYLFGAPMPEANLKYTVRLDRAWFQPEGFPGYNFGGYSWENGEYRSSPGIILSEEKQLDKEGNYNFTCPVISGGMSGPLNLVAEGTITAPDRQRISGRKAALAHNEYYLGLKADTTFIEKGKKAHLALIAVSPKGEKVAGKNIFCKLIRREWNSVKKTGVNGRLEWHTEQADVEITSFTVTSAGQPQEWEYAPEKSGYYIFTAESKDSRNNPIFSSQYFYVTGKDYCAWERDDDDRVELVCDRAKYKPGDTAKIMVKSPYEKANAVVTLEREGIIAQWTAAITGSADTIAVPITAEHLPNVFVCVMLYQGRIGEAKFSAEKDDDLGQPSFKIGYTNLPVDPGDKNLTVTVKSDKTGYKPGETVKIKLQVSGAKNKAAAADLTVSVADQGILSLIDYQTPNSFPYFYGPKPLSVETAETRLHIIGQRNYGEKGESRGGGGGLLESGMYFRSKFLPTVYWNPRVLTDNKGKAELSFVLPDNLTTFRIMATAQTKDSCFGAGESKFVVNKPLLLKPSLPRFALIGDRFSAGVLCHNNTAADGTVTIEAGVKGMKLIGQNSRQIVLAQGEAKEVKFEFLADKTGTAEFFFKAAMAGETDGLKWTVPVKIPRPTEAVATYGSTLDKSKEGIKIPADIYDEASSINLSVAPTALVGLKGGLEYLFDYPYGCLEQKTSKTLPLILAGDFIDIFNLAALKEHSARELISSYLNELPQFQTPSGGFTFWKEGGLDSPYLTAYVLWAIGAAKAGGYAVNEETRTKACEYLRNYLRGNHTQWSWPYNVNAELVVKALCVYALSLNGYSEQAYITNLYQKLDQLPLFGKVYLLKAVHREKMDKTMRENIVQSIANKAKFSPTTVHFEESDDRGMEWIWHSNTRTTAAILQGLLEVEGSYPNAEKVARWLTQERKSGRWLTTQENIYVFYAFAEYVKAYEKENPDFTAEVLLDGKEIIREMFKGRTLEAKNTKISLQGYKRDILLPMIFQKTGAGRLYYDLRMIYAPKGDLEPRTEGLSVEKKIEPFKAGKIQGNSYNLSGRYKVTIRVKTEQERQFVVVDDPLPAGFEVVNMSFSTESQEETRKFGESDDNSFYRWWGTFDHWENYDDRVLIFANYLERGEHTYSYLVQATTPGDFLLPATKAEEMYTPEVFGRTKQERINVK
ncbi:MAG: MG2 domain-containing protein [Elusimicrobiota bacterium]